MSLPIYFSFLEFVVSSSHSDKLALSIDGQALHAMARSLGFDVDFKRLLAELGAGASLVRAY